MDKSLIQSAAIIFDEEQGTAELRLAVPTLPDRKSLLGIDLSASLSSGGIFISRLERHRYADCKSRVCNCRQCGRRNRNAAYHKTCDFRPYVSRSRKADRISHQATFHAMRTGKDARIIPRVVFIIQP